jgi:hypothetical protein
MRPDSHKSGSICEPLHDPWRGSPAGTGGVRTSDNIVGPLTARRSGLASRAGANNPPAHRDER